MPLADRLRFARGDEPADLLLRGGTVVNVASGELVREDVAVADGEIVGLGEGYEAREERDVSGAFVAPAFIEGHLHLESSLLTPSVLAPLLAARGTGTVMADPHEIANVCGAAGIRWIVESRGELPVDIRVMLSSCVPASHLGTAGAELGADELSSLASLPGVSGLAEVMSFPLVVRGDPGVLEKIDRFGDGPIDGHAPGLSGQALNAYVAAGPASDHECTTRAEAEEKLRRGMRVMIREGSTARNLSELIGLVRPETARRFMLVTDDRHVADLLRLGHLDHQLRLAVAAGVDPVTAIGMVTLNPAEHFRLHDRGLVTPGMRADLVVLEDLESFRAIATFHAGRLVAEDGVALGGGGTDSPAPDSHVRVDVAGADISVPAGASSRLRVIGVVAGQIVTRSLEMDATVVDGFAVADPDRDLLKLCVFERHAGTGNVGVGFVQGFGMRRGAIASTVAHDCHNLVVAGCSDDEIRLAATTLADLGGGLAAVDGGRVLASLPLPVAGLMSARPAAEVAAAHHELGDAAANGLGSTVSDPFMLLAFCALEVIGELKLSDKGLIDVSSFEVVELLVE